MSSVLIIFIKNPRRGYVKTRLARTVGEDEALRIYQYLLDKTRQAAIGVQARRLLFYSDVMEAADAWSETDFEKRVQSDGDLGARMEQAFRQAFSEGAQKAGIIGSDCPALDGAALETAFQQLEQADFVLGPTPDGGYYFLGMRAFEPSVFQDIAWSTETVLTQTLAQIRKLRKTVSLLPVLSDIDTETDWLAYKKHEL
ncbi:MAG: TIGR04282 family arsenosugar biosynthesis glycosyltransferase [Bacteroidota bacterium]